MHFDPPIVSLFGRVAVPQSSLSGSLLYRFPVVVLIVDIHASGISISLSLLMLLGVNSFLDLMCVPVRMVAGLVGVFRNGGGLGKSESYIPVMFFDPLLHRFSCFPDVDFAALAGNPGPVDYAILFSLVDDVLWSHQV